MDLDSDSECLIEAEDGTPLTETDYTAQLTYYARKRHPGTLKGLFESAEYKNWLVSSPQTLLISSEPGAGKSVAVACMVQDLFRRFGRGESNDDSIEEQNPDKGSSIVYIFFDSLREEEQSYHNIALCISEQLVSSRLPSKRPKAPPWKKKDNQHFLRPTEIGVSRYLKEQILCHTQWSTVFIVFDALDECPQACRVPLLAVLAEVQREYGRLNVLLTWRKTWAPACEIERLLETTRAFELHANQQELELYLIDHLPPELESRRHVIDGILAVANGRYDLSILSPMVHCRIKAYIML